MASVFTLKFLGHLFLAYLFFSFLHAVFCILRMYRIQHYACDKAYGKRRRAELQENGQLKVLPLYSFEEIAEHKKRGSARLHVFPSKSGKKSRAVFICPGGGYDHLCTKKEGYPVAAKLNDLGYNAFIVEYRTGFNCGPFFPMEDLAKAISLVTEKQDEFNVTMENYAIIGFSAGGNLAGLFGTKEYGYKKYGVKKPGCLILGYPWTNVNHWLQHPYWNIWIGLLGMWLSERGNICMFKFGPHFLRKNRESLCVQNFVTKKYPPTYMYAGGNDVLVLSHSHTDVLEAALKEKKVPYQYEKFFALPHGIGLGVHTSAEGWLTDALEFWNNNTK